jgi:mono/diheme cytochrome c family protein
VKRAALVVVAVVLAACDRTSSSGAGGAGASPSASASAAATAVSTAPPEKVLADNCGICHTLDMFQQQRLTRAQWEKELKKMTGWGAIIPDPDQPRVLDWLAEHAGTDAGPFAFAETTIAEVDRALAPDPAPPDDTNRAKGEAAYKNVCKSCHGLDAKGTAQLGPNLVGRPVIFRAEEFARVVREGRNKMPGFATAFDASTVEGLRAYVVSL